MSRKQKSDAIVPHTVEGEEQLEGFLPDEGRGSLDDRTFSGRRAPSESRRKTGHHPVSRREIITYIWGALVLLVIHPISMSYLDVDPGSCKATLIETWFFIGCLLGVLVILRW